jgi:hypothetical protein
MLIAMQATANPSGACSLTTRLRLGSREQAAEAN